MQSFDVFETALVRRVGLPASAFLLLGADPVVARLTGLRPETFAQLREWTEDSARAAHPSGEVSLEQIHRLLLRSLGLDEKQAGALVEAELALESALLAPNPLVAPAVAQARGEHGGVIWLSDTYVPSSWLAAELRRHGLMQPGDSVYVSNEHAASKAWGNLYGVVAAERGQAPEAFEHVGNDAHADVERAREAGWRARLEPAANPNRLELELEKGAAAGGGLASLLAGASILARLRGRAYGREDPWAVAASVAGPVLGAFVLWILVRAAELGLERIYFVARDGELPLRMARRLQSAVPGAEAIELRYLYGSRQAWHLPAVDLEPGRLDTLLGDDAEQASPRDLLARLRLEPDSVADLLPNADLDKPVGGRAKEFVRELVAQPAFQERVRTAAERARADLLGYLRQEGLLDDRPYACVELGWHGRAGRSLQLVLRAAGHPGAARYQYFGLYAPAGGDGPPEHAEAFLRDYGDSVIDVSVPDLFFLESCCAGIEGRTIMVAPAPDGYRPVLAEPRNEAALEWGLEEIYAGAEAFADELAAGLRAAPTVATMPNVLALRPYIDSVLNTVWSDPTQAEASVLGRFPQRRNLVQRGYETITRPFALGDVVAAFAPSGHPPGGSWYAGSAALSSRALRRLTSAAWRARRLQWRIRRRRMRD